MSNENTIELTSIATFEDCCVALATTTGMDRAEWADFLSLSLEAQRIVADTYKGQDWAQKPDTFATVLAILSVAGSVAGAVSGIGGAYAVLKAL